MTDAEQVQAIIRLGYRPQEAEFLRLAALHSGYFLRRQYRRFLGVQAGASEARLLRKLAARRHAKEHPVGSGARMVHLCSHPFYRAIGQPDNRHRRLRSLPAAQAKVMGLDFVLSHPGWAFLATEQEKVAHFHRSLGIGLASLPCKVYPSPSGAAPTTRYFVDKFPVSKGPPRTSFVYIDAPSVSCSGFETYLRQYFGLIRALPSARVLFATAEPRKIRWARMRFQTLLGARPLPARGLLRFFRLERLFREGALDRLSHQELIDLKEARRRFQGERVEGLFRFWLREGDQPLRLRLRSAGGGQTEFAPYTFEESYDCFKHI